MGHEGELGIVIGKTCSAVPEARALDHVFGYTCANDVTVADIIIAVDEPLDATQCGGKENCHGADAAAGTRCMTHELWATLNAKMVDYLDSVSLQDLVDQQKHKEQNVVVVHRSAAAKSAPRKAD